MVAVLRAGMRRLRLQLLRPAARPGGLGRAAPARPPRDPHGLPLRRLRGRQGRNGGARGRRREAGGGPCRADHPVLLLLRRDARRGRRPRDAGHRRLRRRRQRLPWRHPHGAHRSGRDRGIRRPARRWAPPAGHDVAVKLVTLPGGRFLMGSADDDVNPADGEAPVRAVDVAAFRIAPIAVTNARVAAFVKDTGYVTDAERFGWSFVFHLLVAPAVDRTVMQAAAAAPWWLPVAGASWRTPEGPGSTI